MQRQFGTSGQLCCNWADWQWQSADASMGKARLGGGDAIGRNPTDRSKPGTKRSVVVEAKGGPLGIVVAGRQRPRYQAAGGDPGCRGGGTSASNRAESSASVSG